MSGGEDSIEQLDKANRISHQRWEWTIERLGWLVMACVIVAGLLGYLGRGPLTWRDVANAEGSLRARYYAVERAAAPTRLELSLKSSPARAEKIEVSLSRSFSDRVTLESIVPEPLSVAVGYRELVYTFAVDDTTASGRIIFHYKHDEFGPLEYQVAVEGQQPLRVSQFVLP